MEPGVNVEMVPIDKCLAAFIADSADAVFQRVGVTETNVMIERTLVNKKNQFQLFIFITLISKNRQKSIYYLSLQYLSLPQKLKTRARAHFINSEDC